MDLASIYIENQSSQLSSPSHWVKCAPVQQGQQEIYASFVSCAEGWRELNDVDAFYWSSATGRNCTDSGFL